MKTIEREVSFDAWHAWRTKHDKHDEVRDVFRSQLHGIGLGNVKQLPQVALKGVPGGREMEQGRLFGVVIYVGSGKAALHQKISQAFKFFLGFFAVHAGQVNKPGSKMKEEVAA